MTLKLPWFCRSPGHRNNNKYFPSGWDEIADHWKGMCGYAAKVQGGGNALCNVPVNSHSWQGTGYPASFICGRGSSFTASLGSRNGKVPRKYEFEVTYLLSKSGKYADLMVRQVRCGSALPLGLGCIL